MLIQHFYVPVINSVRLVFNFDVQASYRTYCLLGDGESMEGSVWEALHFAGFYKLDNLCAIIDVNRWGPV